MTEGTSRLKVVVQETLSLSVLFVYFKKNFLNTDVILSKYYNKFFK